MRGIFLGVNEGVLRGAASSTRQTNIQTNNQFINQSNAKRGSFAVENAEKLASFFTKVRGQEKGK
ncbi:MAG: hypothetical protein MJZ35_06645 [Bacteroidaceae bacterium]|nr:hypothetical protein [Bacteroidaceae bacterium]